MEMSGNANSGAAVVTPLVSAPEALNVECRVKRPVRQDHPASDGRAATPIQYRHHFFRQRFRDDLRGADRPPGLAGDVDRMKRRTR